MSKHRAARRHRVPHLVPIVSAAAVIALGASFGISPPGPAPSEAVAPVGGDPVPPRAARGLDRLVVYGHSMPAGGGATDPSLGYAEVAAEGSGLQLLNRAEGKSVAALAAKAMSTFYEARPRDAVVIHTGMNDILRRGNDAASTARVAIEDMLTRSDEAAVVIVLLECRPPSWENTPPQLDRRVAYQLWNSMLVEEAAARTNAVVLDTCAAWDPELNVDPGEYHPNDAGHALIAEDIVAVLADSPAR